MINSKTIKILDDLRLDYYLTKDFTELTFQWAVPFAQKANNINLHTSELVIIGSKLMYWNLKDAVAIHPGLKDRSKVCRACVFKLR